MDEDKVDAVETPVEVSEVETEEQEAVSDDNTATQPTSEAAVENEDTGKDVEGTNTSDWENEKKSLAGRISKYEKELNEYRQSQGVLEALNVAAQNDPEFRRLANKKLVEQGLLDPSQVEEFEASSGAPQQVSQPSDPAVQWARQKMQDEQNKQREFFDSFEEKHPDLLEGSEKVIRANRAAIGAAATRLQISNGLSMEEAYETAYKAVMNPTQLVEEGKLQGIAQAQSASPAETTASGGSANSSAGVTLTQEQKNAARLFGLSEEEYAKSLED